MGGDPVNWVDPLGLNPGTATVLSPLLIIPIPGARIIYGVAVVGTGIYAIIQTIRIYNEATIDADQEETIECPVDLTDDKAQSHILDGDKTGGGHRPGTGEPGKSEFPPDWSDEEILDAISDVATDPNSKTKTGRGGRTIVEGTRNGVDIRVVIENPSRGERIITGYPTNTPRNPR